MKNFSLVTVLLAAFIASSCAHTQKTELKVEQEINAVSAEKTKSISTTIKDQINASGLTADQKTKLLALEESSHEKHTALTDEIERTKVVLIQTVMSPKMKSSELRVLKNKIKSLDKQRLENGFSSLAEVRKIIDPKTNVEQREVYKAMIENRLKGF